MKLKDIHLNYDTDKGTNHSYIETYDLLFERMQYQPINFCEIGVMTGGSLKLWNDYFQSATIYGLDIWLYPEPKDWVVHGFKAQNNVDDIIQELTKNYPRIKLVTCNSLDRQDIDKNFNNDIKFSFIIDDGDHKVESQFLTFTNMIDYLDEDGTYIIEDVQYQNKLLEMIEIHQKNYNLKLNVSYIPFHKKHRPDDALILITKE